MCGQVQRAYSGAECGVCGCSHTPRAFGCLLYDEVVGSPCPDEAWVLVWLKPSWLPKGGSAVRRGPCFHLNCSQRGPQWGASLLRPPTAPSGCSEAAHGLCCHLSLWAWPPQAAPCFTAVPCRSCLGQFSWTSAWFGPRTPSHITFPTLLTVAP